MDLQQLLNDRFDKENSKFTINLEKDKLSEDEEASEEDVVEGNRELISFSQQVRDVSGTKRIRTRPAFYDF